MPRPGAPLPGLRAVRTRALLSQMELARKAGINNDTISRAEAGRTVSYPIIRRLAEVLAVDADVLLNPPPARRAAPKAGAAGEDKKAA